jgi:DNA segregation ATPase FtsK/SpoIIIE-like protein
MRYHRGSLFDRAATFAVQKGGVTAEMLVSRFAIPRLRAFDLLHLLMRERVIARPTMPGSLYRARLSRQEWCRTTQAKTYDPIYNDALNAVFRKRQLTAQTLARALRIDQRRANRLLIEMRRRGVLNDEILSQLAGKAEPA